MSMVMVMSCGFGGVASWKSGRENVWYLCRMKSVLTPISISISTNSSISPFIVDNSNALLLEDRHLQQVVSSFAITER